MNVEYLPSDMLAGVRYRLQCFLERNETPTIADLRDLRQQLKTIQDLAKENEEENRILEHRLRAHSDQFRNRRSAPDIVEISADGNVVQLPIKRRPCFSVVTPDGGDAA